MAGPECAGLLVSDWGDQLRGEGRNQPQQRRPKTPRRERKWLASLDCTTSTSSTDAVICRKRDPSCSETRGLKENPIYEGAHGAEHFLLVLRTEENNHL